MALTDKLTAIADAIRGKTGGTEELTLDGMVTAIAGMEAGGEGFAYDMGEFVLDEDTQANNGLAIPHALGEVPGCVLVWTEEFSGLTSDNPVSYTTATSIGYLLLDGLFGTTGQRYSSSATAISNIYAGFTIPASEYRVGVAIPSSVAYGVFSGDGTLLPTAEYFYLCRPGNNTFWRAGVTYKYFVSKAWWNVGGVANAE